MSIAVVGASAQTAQVALEQVTQTVAPSDLTLITRSPAKLSHWAAKGAEVLQGTAEDPDLLARAFKGKDRVLLVSGLNIGTRVPEHANVINAAKAAGVGHITYTSVAGAHPLSPVPSAKEHVATERLLWESGLSFAALRDQMYFTFFEMMLARAAHTGSFRIHGDKGRMAPVAASDIANCVASILLEPERHDRFVYEITGPDRLTLREIAQIGAEVHGKPIKFVSLTPEEQRADFERAGFTAEPDLSQPVPKCFGSDELVNQWIGNEAGFSDVVTSHVEIITGQKPIDLRSYLTQARAKAA